MNHQFSSMGMRWNEVIFNLSIPVTDCQTNQHFYHFFWRILNKSHVPSPLHKVKLLVKFHKKEKYWKAAVKSVNRGRAIDRNEFRLFASEATPQSSFVWGDIIQLGYNYSPTLISCWFIDLYNFGLRIFSPKICRFCIGLSFPDCPISVPQCL